MLPSGSLTKTWRKPVGPEMTSRPGKPSCSRRFAVSSQSFVQTTKCGFWGIPVVKPARTGSSPLRPRP